MNKYKEALYELKMVLIYNSHKYGDSRLIDLNVETINELVEKATPKKPKLLNDICDDFFKCPECDVLIHYHQRYCDRCGQRIDWSEDDG